VKAAPCPTRAHFPIALTGRLDWQGMSTWPAGRSLTDAVVAHGDSRQTACPWQEKAS
jgi:hypothetical protein